MIVGDASLVCQGILKETDTIDYMESTGPYIEIHGYHFMKLEKFLNICQDKSILKKITFFSDLKIIGMTLRKVLWHEESAEEIEVTDDYGEWLLKNEKVSREVYDRLQEKAKKLLEI